MDTNNITDHALLRYMERVLGIDVEYYRTCALSEIKGYEVSKGVTFKDGVSWIFRDGNLISVIKGRYAAGDRSRQL